MEGVDCVTKEQRILFGLSDIKHIRIKCNKPNCGEETLFSTTGHALIPQGCPYCNRPWHDGQKRIHELEFVALIREEIERQESSQIKIRLEIEDLHSEEPEK